MALFSKQYTINGIASGVALLKLIIMESYIDTNATTKLLRERLSSLDKYIVEIKSDIEKFNLYVKNQMGSLEARGETTMDLLANLFKAYANASDREFKQYIKKKEEEYDDGDDIPPTVLMQKALTKYKTLVEKGKWNAPSDEETKIIALEAQLKKLTRKPTTGDSKGKSNNKTAGNKGRKDNNKDQKKENTKPAWMTVKPKEGEPKKKTVDDKEYFWCHKHESWGRHKAEDCEGKGIKRSDLKSNKKGNNSQKDKKTLKLSRALTSIVEDDDDEESD
jgi:hypothetical protein